jgi:hypothetical protein
LWPQQPIKVDLVEDSLESRYVKPSLSLNKAIT